MADIDKNLSPFQLRKHTLRAGLYALGIISTILIICAIFFAVGISRSAESNRIFELVTYQQTIAEKLAKQTELVREVQPEDIYFKRLDDLRQTIDEAKYVQQHITMADKWGPMDAYEVKVLRAAYLEEPLMLDQRFNEMIAAQEHFLMMAQNGSIIDASEFTRVRETTNNFARHQGQVIKIYLDRIDAVLDQSRWRISLTFLCTFLALAAIGVFFLNPFSKRVESQAKAVRRINEELRLAALRDPLTRLPNRLAFTDYLIRELELAKASNNRLAVVHIDLDHFKEINDKFGHAAGDFMLVEIAKRMRDWEGAQNVIARFGGDEFVAVMSCEGMPCRFQSRAELLLESIAAPMDFEGITLQTSASIGISIYPEFGENCSDLIIHADLALYQSKQAGRDQLSFFEPHMREALDRRKLLESELKTALDEGRIEPFFQPQVNVATNKMCGAEALVRWHHKTRGSVPPSEFLPVAESAGLMVRLGRCVMEKAIIEAAKWHAQNIPFGRLGLNASAEELCEEDFVNWLLATAAQYGLPTDMLSIEILETVMFKDARLNLTDTFARLRSHNIHIELDDFGTGYASLQQVKTDEIDRLKIDRGFIKDIDNEQGNAMIVKAIVELANSLDIAVIAEGAETFGELDCLRKLGCHTIQGFGIAMPMPAEAMRKWIELFVPLEPKLNDNTQSNDTSHPSHKLRIVNL